MYSITFESPFCREHKEQTVTFNTFEEMLDTMCVLAAKNAFPEIDEHFISHMLCEKYREELKAIKFVRYYDNEMSKAYGCPSWRWRKV